MRKLSSYQEDFKEDNKKVLEQLEKEIKAQHVSAYSSIKSISDKFTDKYSGEVLTGRQRKSLNKQLLNGVTKGLLEQGPSFDSALTDTFDNIYTGFSYSYSKVSESFVSYKELTPEQLEIIKLDKINGKTYVDRLDFHSVNLTDTTSSVIQNGIRNGLSNQQIAKGIAKRVGISERHSLTIARTETGRIGSIASLMAQDNALSYGLEFKKVWFHYANEDPRSEHVKMQGKTVDAGERFTLPSGVKTQYPRLTGVAKEDINCHCDVVEEFEGFESTTRRQGTEIVDVNKYDHYKKSNKAELSKRPTKQQAYTNKQIKDKETVVEKVPLPKVVNKKPVYPKPEPKALTLSEQRAKAMPKYKKWVVLDSNKYNKSFDTKKEAYEYGKNMRKKGKPAFIYKKENLDVTNFIP